MDILHRFTRAILYHSETAQTIAGAVAEALPQGADLWCADLRGANLQGADLQGANLQGANLQGADLQGADLWCANLQGANLQGANLQGADLQGANLQGADLQGAEIPDGYRIAFLCFGGWGVTVGPTDTQIGCERHPNGSWLTWTEDAPEIAAMHPNAAVWWARHRESVCAVIRDVMQP